MGTRLRHTLRRLRRSPGFTAATLATLALAMAANVAVFAVVNGVLLKPLPYPNADRLVRLRFGIPGVGIPDLSVSVPMYVHLRDRGQALAEVAVYDGVSANLTGGDRPERLTAAQVSDGFFNVLRTPPTLGRGFRREDTAPGAAPVAVVSDGLWRRRFGGDPSIVGQTIRVDGVATEVVGVAAPMVALPTSETELWVPLTYDPAEMDFGAYYLDAVARLAPGATMETAGLELEASGHALPEAFPGHFGFVDRADVGFTTRIQTLKDDVVGDVRSMLWVVLGGISFLLLIACANVANLFLVRGEARAGEVAVRTALGATPRGLAGTFLAESALLAAGGAALGLYLAWLGLDAFMAWNPADLPRAAEIGIDATVAAFATILALGTGLLLGLLPARHAVRPDVVRMLRQEDRGASPGRHVRWTRGGLVATQVAMAIVLLVGAGLLGRSYQALRHVDPGFDPTSTLTFRVSLPHASYPSDQEAGAFFNRLSARLAALPGVEHAAAINWLPLAPGGSEAGFHIQDRPWDQDAAPIIPERFVTADYFQAMGIPIVEGRPLSRDDLDNGRPVTVVSRDLARRFWPGQSPLGKRIGTSAQGPWLTIVGVAGEVRDVALTEQPTNLRYAPATPPAEQPDRSQADNMSVVVRTNVPPTSLLPAIRREVAALDPDVPVATVQTLDDIVRLASAQLSLTSLLIGFAALMSLLLGTVGIYGVIAYVIGRRTREIGVRMALGADRHSVHRLVLASGLRMAAIGIAAGLPAALAVGHLLSSLLFQVEPADPMTFVGVTTLVLAVAAAASYIPARRAARIDPMHVLR